GLDACCIIEISKRLGAEVANLCVRALEPFLERFDRARTESFEPRGRDSSGCGIEEVLTPSRHPAYPELGAIDHLQVLHHSEESRLILVIECGNLELEIARSLRSSRSLLMTILDPEEPLIHNGFEHFGSAEALAVLSDDERERVLLLDFSASEHATYLWIIGL